MVLTVRSTEDSSFPFLALSPELRNRVYDFVLRIPGRFQPSTKPPSSIPKDRKRGQAKIAPHSGLGILAVNKQIHDEAVGIFYHCNEFDFHVPAQMHGFVNSLSPLRQTFVRDISLRYRSLMSGGVDVTAFSMQVLKQLPGLRKLHIHLGRALIGKIKSSHYMDQSQRLDTANPGLLPGIGHLFELRGVTDIKLLSDCLEERLEEARKTPQFPRVDDVSTAVWVQLGLAFEHFNAALADAQKGKVNKKLLEDNKWQTWDVFPPLEGQT